MESPRPTLSSRLSYANVMATVAVFAVLGGTGYAAVALPNASVGNAQLKANAVDSSKVINGSLLKADFKARQLPKRATGAKGATGATGATGAAGAKGDKGDSFTLATTLATGQTETGQYSAWGSTNGGFLGQTVSYRIPLPATVLSANVHFLTAPLAFTVNCPAVGQALAGHLCVYEYTSQNRSFGGIFSLTNAVAAGSAKDGFDLWFTSTGAGSFTYGEYAVTAP